MTNNLSAYQDGQFHHLKPRNEPDCHQFCTDDGMLCRFCGGYPFDPAALVDTHE